MSDNLSSVRAPPKSFASKPILAGAALQKAVDQKLHQMHAVAFRLARVACRVVGAGQQKMIHAADARQRVVNAGGDTGAKQGQEHNIRIVGNDNIRLE